MSEILLAGCLLVGCRCSDAPAPAGSAGATTASAGSAAAPAPECQRTGMRLTLLASGETARPPAQPDAAAEPEPEVDLPFSVEPGMALELAGDFFATALRHEPHGNVALLARLPRGAEGRAPTQIELGRLAGDSPPPRLAVDGGDLLVAIEEPVGDPRSPSAGYRVRLARLTRAELVAPALPAQLQWHEGPSASRGESNAFDVAAALPNAGANSAALPAAAAGGAPGGAPATPPGSALFAWDDWPKGESHGRVYVQSLGSDGRAGVATAISAPGVDAEEPRLVARPGGYWLAWLVDAGAAKGRTYDPGEAEVAAPSGGAGTAPPAPAGPNGARGIEVIPLDAAGQPAGNVRRIRTDSARVVGYDLTLSGAGNAWVVWRQDASSAGAAGGRVLMAEVSGEGPGAIVPVREEDVGSGEPTWLAAASAGQSPWLTFPDQRDRTLLLPIDYPQPAALALGLASDLQGAAALTAVSGHVLFAHPRGRSLELFVAACAPVPLR